MMTTPPESKRERTKAENRAAILAAAREVFIERGYDAAGVRDIVARTKLAPGTFYNYFPDKESVLRALVDEASTEGARRVREARAAVATSVEAMVYAGFRAFFEFIASDHALFELTRRNFASLRSLGLDESGFAAGLVDLRRELEHAIDKKLLPPLPLDYLVRSIFAITLEVGAVMAASDPPDIDGATDFAATLCLGGLTRLTQQTAARAAGSGAVRKKKTQK
ncbi:MAG: TetR/AcrR family transcriptional regulator [Polyangiales bacterium]